MLATPRHSFAIKNSVCLSTLPRMQAKPPRSSSIVCSTSPPSRTRTHRLLGTSAYQGAFRVETNAVRDTTLQIGPHSAIRQATVNRDVEGREPFAVGLGHDQGRVVGGHGHAVGECDVVCDLLCRAIGGDQRDDSGGELLTGEQVEAAAVDIGVATTVHDDLVPALVCEAAQVGIPITSERRSRSIAVSAVRIESDEPV